MGTILKEGEYILVSHKITNETGYIGYSVLSHIGINTSKVNLLGSTRHFQTYAVIKDLELPFDTSELQIFEVDSVRFHAYTRNFKNLILMEHDLVLYDEFDYFDEIDEFFEKKKKEKENMILKKGNYIYISTNTWNFSDASLLTALLGYYYTDIATEEHLGATSDDHLLWSRTKFTMDIDFKAVDALPRLHNLNSELDFVRTSKGDVIIYKDVNNERIRIFEAYKKYSKDDTEKEKENMLNNNTFSISNNSAWANRIDDVIFADNMAYMAATQSVPDKLPDITLEDLSIESSVRAEPLIRGTLRVSPGIIRETRKFQFTQYAGYKYLFEGRQLLNSFYGLNGGLNYKKPPLKFKLIFGREHATGRYKTICLWEDGEKTIIHGDNKVTKLPVAQAFAWCYVKRTFGTVSHFKKHVDKRTTKMDGVWYFEGDCIMDDYAQGSVPGTSKKRDIYDAAALAIVTKRYGGLRKLVDEYINKEDE